MRKYWVILILLLPAGAYCLCAAVFFAWVTATPVSPESLQRARWLCEIWFGGFVAAALLGLAVVVRMVYLFRKARNEPTQIP